MKYKIGDIIRRKDFTEVEEEYPFEKIVIISYEEGKYVFGKGNVKHTFESIDKAPWLYKSGNILKETLARL